MSTATRLKLGQGRLLAAPLALLPLSEWRRRLVDEGPVLHAVIKSRSLNPEKRSGRTRVIHKGEGFTDRKSKTVQKDSIEDSAQTSIPKVSFASSQYCCSV